MNILIPYHDPGGLAHQLISHFPARIEPVQFRRFPDGESYVRFDSVVRDQEVCIVAAPLLDEMLPGLWFLCDLLRQLGVGSISLLVPYLPYMRQDQAFYPGETISARSFAGLLSSMADQVITVDPHLHRIHRLDEIFTIPTHAIHTASFLSVYLRTHFTNALVIGPDSESEQWAAAVAHGAGLPYVICTKVRHGDREVEVAGEISPELHSRTPVVVDDILSTGRTLGKVADFLRNTGLPAPVCIAVHGVCAGDALDFLKNAGYRQILTTNTLPNPVACLDITPVIAKALHQPV